MQHPKPGFSLSQEVDMLPEDDIDELFGKLEPIEPPPALIARIISEVSRLSRTSQTDQTDQIDQAGPELLDPLAELALDDPLIVRKEKQEPS